MPGSRSGSSTIASFPSGAPPWDSWSRSSWGRNSPTSGPLVPENALPPEGVPAPSVHSRPGQGTAGMQRGGGVRFKYGVAPYAHRGGP